VRPAYPTASELQRMPWHARERMEKRLKAQRRDPLADADRTALPDTRVAARQLGEIDLIEAHRRYLAGIRAPDVVAGEREYQRRRKARQRGSTTEHDAWTPAHAIALREQGCTDQEIAQQFGIKVESLRRRIKRFKQRMGEAA
jgi:hypothetical protein